MGMDEDTRVLRDYLIFTVPHVTVLAGAILGILLVAGVNPIVALAIFTLLYGVMLLAVWLVVMPHFSHLVLYKLLLLLFSGLSLLGLFLLLYWKMIYMG